MCFVASRDFHFLSHRVTESQSKSRYSYRAYAQAIGRVISHKSYGIRQHTRHDSTELMRKCQHSYEVAVRTTCIIV